MRFRRGRIALPERLQLVGGTYARPVEEFFHQFAACDPLRHVVRGPVDRFERFDNSRLLIGVVTVATY